MQLLFKNIAISTLYIAAKNQCSDFNNRSGKHIVIPMAFSSNLLYKISLILGLQVIKIRNELINYYIIFSFPIKNKVELAISDSTS